MSRLLERAAFFGTLGVGFTLSAAWTALLGYGLFRVAATVF